MAFHTDYATLPGVKANSTGLATSQYKFVKLASTAGQVVLNGTSVFLNSTVGNCVGVLMNAPAGNEAALVAIGGVCKAKSGQSTAIAIGAFVTSNSTSLAVDAGLTDNAEVLGRALTATTAANDIFTVLLIPGGARY